MGLLDTNSFVCFKNEWSENSGGSVAIDFKWWFVFLFLRHQNDHEILLCNQPASSKFQAFSLPSQKQSEEEEFPLRSNETSLSQEVKVNETLKEPAVIEDLTFLASDSSSKAFQSKGNWPKDSLEGVSQVEMDSKGISISIDQIKMADNVESMPTSSKVTVASKKIDQSHVDVPVPKPRVKRLSASFPFEQVVSGDSVTSGATDSKQITDEIDVRKKVSSLHRKNESSDIEHQYNKPCLTAKEILVPNTEMTIEIQHVTFVKGSKTVHTPTDKKSARTCSEITTVEQGSEDKVKNTDLLLPKPRVKKRLSGSFNEDIPSLPSCPLYQRDVTDRQATHSKDLNTPANSVGVAKETETRAINVDDKKPETSKENQDLGMIVGRDKGEEKLILSTASVDVTDNSVCVKR